MLSVGDNGKLLTSGHKVLLCKIKVSDTHYDIVLILMVHAKARSIFLIMKNEAYKLILNMTIGDSLPSVLYVRTSKGMRLYFDFPT